MTITTGPVDAAVLAAARAREAEIRQAARDTWAAIAGPVNTHPGPDFAPETGAAA